MLESWVIVSTIRLNSAIKIAEEVLKTECNLAIGVNGDKSIFKGLQEIQRKHPQQFLLRLGNWRQSVEVTNELYGILRTRNPSKNILAFPLPDDMRLNAGWYEGFAKGYNDAGQPGVAVLAGNDGRTNCNVAGFAGLTAEYCDIHQNGWLLCPEYLHWYLDFEITRVALRLGLFYKCPAALAVHQMLDHSSNIHTDDFDIDHTVFEKRNKLMFSYNGIPEAPWRYYKSVKPPTKKASKEKKSVVSTPPAAVKDAPKKSAKNVNSPIKANIDKHADAKAIMFCATHGRLAHAKRTVQNVLDTSDCHIIMIVGQSRPEYEELSQYVESLPHKSRVSVVFYEESKSFSDAINTAWGLVRQTWPGENILGLATADDMEFKPKWFTHAMICYDRYLPERDGLMFLNDLKAPEMNVPNVGANGLCMVSAKFCDLYMAGWLVSPFYPCNWIDIEYAEVAKKHNKMLYCPDANVYHLLIGWDETFNSQEFRDAKDTYYRRLEEGFPYPEAAPWRHWR